MKLFGLHIEHKDNLSFLVCCVETKYKTRSDQLWLSLDSDYENLLSVDVYDAFLVAFLYPAMFYNEEEIVIEGNISPRLYFHLTNYLQHILKAYNSELSFVKVSPQGFSVPKQTMQHIGTGFTGGIDAFTTIIDRYENEKDSKRRIDMLFFNNFSSHTGATGYLQENEKAIAHEYYELLKGFPQSIGIPYVQVDSNIFDFWVDRWEYTIRSLANAFMVLALQKGIKYYYLSGEFSYKEHIDKLFTPSMFNLEEVTELYLFPHLCTEVVDILQEGSQYSRLEKTEKVVKYLPARDYLNVCTCPHKEGKRWNVHNCNYCTKCTKVLLALDVLGELDNFSKVFDIEDYKIRRHDLWCECLAGLKIKPVFMQEIVDYAHEHGYDGMPSQKEMRKWKNDLSRTKKYGRLFSFPRRVVNRLKKVVEQICK